MLLFSCAVLSVCLADMYVDVRSAHMSICMHITTREPLEGYSWNFVQENLRTVDLISTTTVPED